MYYNTKTDEYLSVRELRDLLYDYWDETIDEDWMLEMIDDCADPIHIFNGTFSPGEVWLKMDPIGFKCAMSDEVQYRADDSIYDISIAKFTDGETLSPWGLDYIIWKENENE